MPRMDYRASVETELLSEELRMVLAILVDEVNLLRHWAGQPPLTPDALQGKIRQYRRLHPRGSFARPEEQ